jgi:hypothetical protein
MKLLKAHEGKFLLQNVKTGEFRIDSLCEDEKENSHWLYFGSGTFSRKTVRHFSYHINGEYCSEDCKWIIVGQIVDLPIKTFQE